jgi:uncharacterized Zn-binding protein involved in type VI secretion
MKPVIRLGDPTSHGGAVVSAASTTSFFGKQVACLGDAVSCPQQGHTSCTIIEGDPSWSIGGRPVALDGHKTSCGATLISTLGQVMRDYASSSNHIDPPAMPLMPALPVLASLPFDLHFQLLGEQTGKPMKNVGYKLTLEDGTTVTGQTDEHGMTEKIAAAYPAIATLTAPYHDNNNDTESIDPDCECDTCCSEDS